MSGAKEEKREEREEMKEDPLEQEVFLFLSLI
jgi:hypothetical protein